MNVGIFEKFQEFTDDSLRFVIMWFIVISHAMENYNENAMENYNENAMKNYNENSWKILFLYNFYTVQFYLLQLPCIKILHQDWSSTAKAFAKDWAHFIVIQAQWVTLENKHCPAYIKATYVFPALLALHFYRAKF